MACSRNSFLTPLRLIHGRPDTWALPSDLLMPDLDGSLDDAARRVLSRTVSVGVRYLEQVTTVSGPDCDPRGWSVSTVYFALLARHLVPAVAGTSVQAIDACNPEELQQRPAFDHALLLEKAFATLRIKVRQGALPLHLLVEKFTLTELQLVREAVLGIRCDKGAFRRLIKDAPLFHLLAGEFLRGPQRPAQLFRAATDFRF